MIAFARPVRRAKTQDAWQARFLEMVPAIRRCARHAFRNFDEEEREDAVQEVIANSLVAFVRLHSQGRSDLAFPTVLARYAVAQYRAGRHVGTRVSGNDVFAKRAQQRNGFHIERLEDVVQVSGEWIEAMLEDPKTSVPDQAAFRCDFPAWLATHSPRNRRIAEALAIGESTSEIAMRFKVSRGRISQLRNEFYLSWHRFHGEPTALAN